MTSPTQGLLYSLLGPITMAFLQLPFCHPTAHIPGKDKLSGVTAESMFDSEIHETTHDVNRP